ncbi:MAG: methionyl-tRNA formyltransferase [Spirochaetales bacterium]|nr:methionyl-tRNA formyltransferase [Spirochaetales bacterium]
MRILFAGTPEFAVPSLLHIADKYPVAGVLTAPDRQMGRGRHTGFSAVKQAAIDHNLHIIQPEKLTEKVREHIGSLQPELLVCTAYGKIFRQNFLDLFPLGGINVHPSLLPKYRGPSPVNAAILAGDSRTGVTVQRLALKMDSGSILAQSEYLLQGDETAASLSLLLAEIGGKMLPEVIGAIDKHTLKEIPQNDSEASFCSLIQKNDGDISWNEDAALIERMIRAYTPWPGVSARFMGKRLFFRKSVVYPSGNAKNRLPAGTVEGVDKDYGILIHTINGILAVQELQLEFKKALGFKEFVNGNKEILGYLLGGY